MDGPAHVGKLGVGDGSAMQCETGGACVVPAD